MKLPQAENAIVDDAKVRDYLLSVEHPVGRFKARVFIAAGYQRERFDLLRDDLLAAASVIEVTTTRSDEFGRRFVGTADLRTPAGGRLPVVTVWIISSEGAPPRLLTAYPAEDS
jgi:hypothetical protein